MRRALVPAVAVVLVVGLIAFEVISSGSNQAPQPAPALPAVVLRPPRATLAELRGKPALINFWASWCEPCHKEAPELERFNRALHGAGRLVGVDYADQAGPARAFIHQYGWTFPVLSDPSGTYGARYDFSGLPTTFVLDSRGRIVQTLHGPQTATGLRRALESARRSD